MTIGKINGVVVSSGGMTQEQIDKLAGIATGADVTGSNAPQAHTIASHSDTTGTGAELETLTDGSETALHSHADGGGATKELFVPVTYVINGVMSIWFNHPIAQLNAVGEAAYISFFVPNDFSSITSAVIAVIPMATVANADWTIEAIYAANGEATNTHSAVDVSTTYNVTNNQIYEVDISGILLSLAAGDYVGVMLRQTTTGHNVNVLGVRFKYS